MKELVTQIEIDASPERVWQILVDFAEYGTWNPFLYRVAGEPIIGSQVRIYFKAFGRETKLNCSIITLEPNRALVWKWHLFLPGLYGGERSFLIEPLDGDRVRLVDRETFSGLLLPLFNKSIDTATKQGFEAMDQALKARAEQA
jgi:hypothetical protein